MRFVQFLFFRHALGLEDGKARFSLEFPKKKK